ncbi:hypothetical protein ASAP_3198 [Asaia bogorensis]|uniref:Uncharacterized protein n=1 Tax=Asaia bogorensis TaxID=91915 RepID=A0A060QKC1_9PROT|nr:hypothetical protein ASAP_3198 [Asaia bogorensis]
MLLGKIADDFRSHESLLPKSARNCTGGIVAKRSNGPAIRTRLSARESEQDQPDCQNA